MRQSGVLQPDVGPFAQRICRIAGVDPEEDHIDDQSPEASLLLRQVEVKAKK